MIRSPISSAVRSAWRPVLGPAISQVQPTLDLNFASGTMPPGLTFSRASNATMIGKDGLVGWAPHNLLLYSGDISNAVWNKSNGGTVTSVADPFGGMGAQQWTVGALGGAGLQQAYTIPNSTVTVSGWFRVSSGSRVLTLCTHLDTGSGVTVTSTWQRLSVTSTGLTQGGAGQVRIDRSAVSGQVIEMYGLQVNAGPLQPYYPTTGSAYYGPRIEYDPATLACRGLLMEPAATNLVPNSKGSILSTQWGRAQAFGNGAEPTEELSDTDPLGYDGSSYRLAGTTANINHFLLDSVAIGVSSGATYTYRANVQRVSGTAAVSSANIAILWYDASSAFISQSSAGSGGAVDFVTKLVATGAAPANATTAKLRIAFVPSVAAGTAVDFRVRVSGNQFEAGPVATSYIPTAGASATRAAEVCSKAVSGIGGWNTAGTICESHTYVSTPIGFNSPYSLGSSLSSLALLSNSNSRAQWAGGFLGPSVTGADGSSATAFNMTTVWLQTQSPGQLRCSSLYRPTL